MFVPLQAQDHFSSNLRGMAACVLQKHGLHTWESVACRGAGRWISVWWDCVGGDNAGGGISTLNFDCRGFRGARNCGRWKWFDGSLWSG
jgi:hypothetical protein